MEIDIAGAIKDFGFPVIAAFGMGYFIRLPVRLLI